MKDNIDMLLRKLYWMYLYKEEITPPCETGKIYELYQEREKKL